jgi:hypothetical protein
MFKVQAMSRSKSLMTEPVTGTVTSLNDRCSGTCAGHERGFPRRAQFGFTKVEDVTIDVLRGLCDVYATGSGEGWDAAHRLCEAEFGLVNGPLLVARVTTVIRALRSERHGNLSYLGFGCQHICPDELAILTLIKSERLDEVSVRDGVIAIVVRNGPARRLTLAATRALADLHRDLVEPRAEQETDCTPPAQLESLMRRHDRRLH